MTTGDVIVKRKIGQCYSLDELVLNYDDACIYGRDLRLFEEDGEWLNDACINFQFRRLEKLKDGGNALLMDPAVTAFFMHQCEDDDEMVDFAAGYNDFQSFTRIFIPINDAMASSSWQTPGIGTHWSLLLMVLEFPDTEDEEEKEKEGVSELRFFHFDSVPGTNHTASSKVAYKWSHLLFQYVGSKESRERADWGRGNVHVQECKVPKQKNGYDCGVHVLATTELLLELPVPNKNEDEFYNGQVFKLLSERLQSNCNFCRDLRKKIAEDIRKFAEQQE